MVTIKSRNMEALKEPRDFVVGPAENMFQGQLYRCSRAVVRAYSKWKQTYAQPAKKYGCSSSTAQRILDAQSSPLFYLIGYSSKSCSPAEYPSA